MYFHFLGGSALLHLLAAHPKIVAVFGIVATIGMLSTSTAPHTTLGLGRHARDVERSLTREGRVDEEFVRAAGALSNASDLSRAQVEAAVRHFLAQCGTGCNDLTPAVVMGDAKLLQKALFVAALDRRSAADSAHGRTLVTY